MATQARDFESYIEAFEEIRARGSVNDLLNYAPPRDDPNHVAVLRELIRIDLEMGWDQGNPAPLDEYRQRFGQLFENSHGNEIAFEEYRLRHLAGQRPVPEEYGQRGYNVSNWPSTFDRDDSEDLAPTFVMSSAGESRGDSAASSDAHPLVSVVPLGGDGTNVELRARLHYRLRFVALGCIALPAYFLLLTWLNPTKKVAFSLENWLPIGTTIACLLGCAGMSAALWSRIPWKLSALRHFEVGLFGLTLAHMALGFCFDIFIAHELREPLAQGEHNLFHYGSSWSLPFVILIVAYGTLVPSTWRRCTRVVVTMSVVPLVIAIAGGAWEGMLDRTYLQSFLLQMALWLAGASAIAVFGTRRLEVLQRQVTEARRLGQYRVKERIGAGGMGEVFLAEHILLRRPCALKLIRFEIAGDPSIRRRFEHEVRITATLTHPNTIQIFDYGHTRDGTFYYVMEYLPGNNLAQIVTRHGPLQPDRAVHIVRQICGSLREAHAAGLTHRDLKPSNVILCERGGIPDTAKLLDFGLAITSQNLREQSGTSIEGSPLYMSPEQAAGRADIDARADIYGVGALLYFLVTGRPPFVRSSVREIVAAHRTEAVTPPSQIRAEIPIWLEQTIMRCLEKEPTVRYQTIEELMHALDNHTRPF